jgi:drug/metabolite transporter (DMT)-like permease
MMKLVKAGINLKAYIAWVAVCIVWGTTFLAIRVGVTILPPLLFAGFRWLAAGLIIFTILVLKGVKLPDRKDIFRLAVPGICLLGISNVLIVIIEQWIPSGLVALLVATCPFWMFFAESRINKELRFNGFTVTGMVIGFLGTIIIFTQNVEFALDKQFIIGLLLLIISLFSWCFGSLYAKYKSVDVNPFMGAAIQMLIAGTAQTVLGLVLGELSAFHFDKESLLSFLYLIFVASILGYGSYMYAIKHLPVSFVSTHAYVNPIIALFLGWLILGEPMSISIVLGAGIILSGVFLIKKGTSKST